MKQDAFLPDDALESEETSARRDPQRIARPEQQELWPAQWDWEADNDADGLGIGPFPTARKGPKRATRAAEAQLPADDDERED